MKTSNAVPNADSINYDDLIAHAIKIEDIEKQLHNSDIRDKFVIEDLPDDYDTLEHVHPADQLSLQKLSMELAVADYEKKQQQQQQQHVHDQLPSVEEAKMYAAREKGTTTTTRKNKKLIFIIIGLLLLIGGILGIFVGVSKAKNGTNGQSATLESRSDDVINFLFTERVTPLPSLYDVTFPQHKAAMFVADGDDFRMDYTGSMASARRFIERYVVAVIYYHFNGDQWNYRLNFLSAQDHCNWYDSFETVKTGKTIRLGVECDSEGFVTKINLSQNGLSGPNVPDEIQFLTRLESLHLYFNEINGPFPVSVRGMNSLKSLALMNTGLSGPLPDWIGDLTQLTTLALGNNNLNGAIPASMSHLTNLRILGLDDNDRLTGNLQTFYGMSHLEALYLEDNAFSGQLPSEDRIWPSLVELDVSNNMLDETLPAALLNHKKLAVLDVHKNMLSGIFPTDIFQNTNLEVLAVQENLIQGSVPDRLPFLSKLKHLDLSHNKLGGSLPDDLIQLTDLRYLATSNNPFASQPILDLSALTNLMDISMKHNNLQGEFPEWVANLPELRLLDLDSNHIHGSIPTWIGLARNLRHVLLNRNELTGTLPPQIGNLKKLDVLLLDGNSIHGNAEFICEANDVRPTYFTADCYPGRNGEKPEIDCRCCSTCCADDDPTCNNFQWTANFDPVWEYGFLRPNYVFSLANAPSSYSKQGDDPASDPIDDAFNSRRVLEKTFESSSILSKELNLQ